jgi:hypothetical protein
LIDSDEELEELSKQHPKATTSDAVVGRSEEAVFTREDEQSSEFCDHSMTPDAPVEDQAQDKERTLQLNDRQSSTRAMGHFVEVPLPRIPSESSVVHEVPVPAKADAGTTNDNSDIAMSADNVRDIPKDARIDLGTCSP